ncbi:MAG: hypothetical protein KIT84_26785 [Labilithrix sp.]|nr:hypothetical protein [Labilithrix sp.]MCW5814661.1 hypothetical protein [Labilithrix sp.]
MSLRLSSFAVVALLAGPAGAQQVQPTQPKAQPVKPATPPLAQATKLTVVPSAGPYYRGIPDRVRVRLTNTAGATIAGKRVNATVTYGFGPQREERLDLGTVVSNEVGIASFTSHFQLIGTVEPTFIRLSYRFDGDATANASQGESPINIQKQPTKLELVPLASTLPPGSPPSSIAEAKGKFVVTLRRGIGAGEPLGGQRVLFTFIGSSDERVTDSSGKIVVNGIIPSGQNDYRFQRVTFGASNLYANTHLENLTFPAGS